MSTSVAYSKTNKSVSHVVVTSVEQVADDRIGSPLVTQDKRRETRQQAVEENLGLFVDSEVRPRYIRPDHECFDLKSVVAFREKHSIDVDDNRWNNFKQLLCGCQDLPFIILQNPTKLHVKDYQQMKKCRTMTWLSVTLAEIGLTLEEVVVLDVCSLLSDDDLETMDSRFQDKWGAVEESYRMTEDILRFLKPDVAILCQCSTKGRADGKISVGSHAMSVVYGVHPSRAHWSKATRPVLKGVFRNAFVPCMEWFEMYGREPMVSTTIEVAPLDPQEADELDEQFSNMRI